MDIHTQVTQPASLYAALHGTGVISGANEYLAFRLGTQEYAVDISDIQEIRNYERPTRMLGAASYVPGVLSLRGAIVPIIDMRMRLNLPANLDSSTVIIVMGLECGTVGVVVDSVSDVVRMEQEDIQYLPRLNDSSENRLFQGLGTCDCAGVERTLILVDFHNLMPRTPSQFGALFPSTNAI